LTFVGTVPQGTLTNTVFVTSGFNMVSSVVPLAGDLCTNLSLTNIQPGDVVFTYANPPGSYTSYFVDPFGPGAGVAGSYMQEWDSPDPQITVAEGFWYQANSGAPTPTGAAWVQTFSVNQ